VRANKAISRMARKHTTPKCGEGAKAKHTKTATPMTQTQRADEPLGSRAREPEHSPHHAMPLRSSPACSSMQIVSQSTRRCSRPSSREEHNSNEQIDHVVARTTTSSPWSTFSLSPSNHLTLSPVVGGGLSSVRSLRWAVVFGPRATQQTNLNGL
jgi:hypothetical protein